MRPLFCRELICLSALSSAPREGVGGPESIDADIRIGRNKIGLQGKEKWNKEETSDRISSVTPGCSASGVNRGGHHYWGGSNWGVSA